MLTSEKLEKAAEKTVVEPVSSRAYSPFYYNDVTLMHASIKIHCVPKTSHFVIVYIFAKY